MATKFGRGAWFALGALVVVSGLRGLRKEAPPPAADDPRLSPAARVGARIFFDRALSASGTMACATCHDPKSAYAAPNALAVQRGGPDMNVPGTRAVPSLRYLEYVQPYADLADNPDNVTPPGPGGGLTRDGRASSHAEQARIPLLAPNEMANASEADVVHKLEQSDYADAFRAAFGGDVFGDAERAFQSALAALQAYQLEDESFHPYNSKFDLYLTNKIGGELTAAEARGLEVYAAPDKGNCFACHYDGPGLGGANSLFTDFTYAALGVPRNPAIPANADTSYADLGICSRPDHPLPDSASLCGMFKVPTLRNVATRKVFFHNGRFTSLREVLRFYNTRDTQPELWYPVVNGVVQKFDDLPEAYRANVDPQPPLDGRAAGSQPAMSEQDLDDLEAFLRTLDDDFVPGQAPVASSAAGLPWLLLMAASIVFAGLRQIDPRSRA